MNQEDNFIDTVICPVCEQIMFKCFSGSKMYNNTKCAIYNCYICTNIYLRYFIRNLEIIEKIPDEDFALYL